MNKRTKLNEIDKENWRFVLYENPDKDWIATFVYSPTSFVDLSILIKLNENEKKKAIANRNFLIELSEKIRNNYKEYLTRSLKREDYEFVLKPKIK